MAFADLSGLAFAMLEAVPFARTLNISFVEVGIDEVDRIRVVAELPEDPRVHNHIGGPHAGALFTLAETASGAVVMAAFGDQLARVVPLAVSAQITYHKVAMGVVRANATLCRGVAEVIAELDAGVRPEFDVSVTLSDVAGLHTTSVVVRWTLRPHREPADSPR